MKKNAYYKLIESVYYTSQNIRLATHFYNVVKNFFDRKVNLACEIGCGYGVAASCFKEMASHLVLVDTDLSALEYVKSKFGDVCSTRMDFAITQCPDLIYFFMSLHHIQEFHREIENAVNCIVRNNTIVAICEVEPNPSVVFHKDESSPYDGLKKSDFSWVKEKYPFIKTSYIDLPSIEVHNMSFNCYCLILSR